MVVVKWLGGMGFEAETESGLGFSMDATPESGGSNLGPTPVEALLSAVAGCSAMDVISILGKKQQAVTSYRVEIDGVRAPEGTWPRPFLSITLKHIVSGNDIDEVAVARAVQLSDEKYCTVISTLRTAPTVNSEFVVE